MSRTKKTAKVLGASLLATATLASGLSFGSAAIAAPSETPKTQKAAPAATDTFEHFALGNGAGSVIIWNATKGWALVPSDEASGQSIVKNISMPAVGERGKVTGDVLNADGSLNYAGCLWGFLGAYTDNLTAWNGGSTCSTFERTAGGGLKFLDGRNAGYWLGSSIRTYSTPAGTGTAPNLESTEARAGIPVAVPGSESAAPVDVQGSLPADVTKNALVQGTGEPDATITVTDDQDPANVTTTTVDEDGSWKARPAAPGAGKHTFSVTQTIGEQSASEPVTVELDYGREVSITSPADGETTTPDIALTLNTQADAELTVTEGDDELATATASGANETIKVTNLSAGTHTLTVKQQSRGNLTTTAQITVTVKDDAISLPFTVATPLDGSTHKGESTTFSGNGTAGDTVTLHVTNFASADVTTTVKQDGTWSVDRFIGTGAYVFDITQTNPAGTETGAVKDLKINQPTENPGQNLPFKVTTPTNGSDHKGEYTEFSGEGRAGETVTVTVTNFDSTDVTTTVKQDGTWSVKKFTGTGEYVIDIIQTNAAGTETGAVKDLKVNPAP